MHAIKRKDVIYTCLLIAFGVILNRLVTFICSHFGVPLYLDTIGTMYAAAVGGIFPGMIVGFFTNMIGGFSDTTTFYYGTINVLIALIAGIASERGYFEKFHKVFMILPFYMIISVISSLLTFVLFSLTIGDSVSTAVVKYFYDLGLPAILAQIVGDIVIEIPDKLISLIVTFILIKVTPAGLRTDFGRLSGKNIRHSLSPEENEKRSSLRKQIGIWFFIAGLCIMLIAFFVSYKSYLETKLIGLNGETVDMVKFRTETLLFAGKMLSAVLGLLLCLVSFAMLLADRAVVTPLHRMAKEMRRFAYDSESGRNHSVEKIEKLDIHTDNEIEELYQAMLKTVKDIDTYIDTTNEQAQMINTMHENLILTLADFAESRDAITGNHVKRTAEYCVLLAEELRAEGKHTDILTDEYIATLAVAAPMHDIGKIQVSDAILNKPGKLTDEEFEMIKKHTIMGRDMLERAKSKMGSTEYLNMAEDIACYHHEWWDGNLRGYPEHLSGNIIPLSARIMAVADVFDALMSRRPYKPGFSVEKTLSIMKEERGTHFDPEVFDAMMRILDKMRVVDEKYMEKDYHVPEEGE